LLYGTNTEPKKKTDPFSILKSIIELRRERKRAKADSSGTQW